MSTSHSDRFLASFAAMHELQLALTRYERLVSPPRHLHYPVVGDLQAINRAREAAMLRGNTARASELAQLIVDEHRRRSELERWQSGQVDRRRGAYLAAACRLQVAIADAKVHAGLTGDSLQFALDRYRDCCHRVQYAIVSQAIN